MLNLVSKFFTFFYHFKFPLKFHCTFEDMKILIIEFDGFEIDEVEFVEKPDFTGYEIALEKEETEVEVLVNKAGEITIKKVNVEDEDDEDDDEEEEEDDGEEDDDDEKDE